MLKTPVIAFLGIGLMGHPMALRLLQSGFAVRAWNRTAGKAERLREAGAEPCATVADTVRGAAIVVSMLEDGAAVGAVIDAAIASLAPGTLWIDMSSTQHGEALAFHARMDAAEVSFLDAPVSGGVAGAEAGSLAIMAGGSIGNFAHAEPILAAMGRPTLVGPAGSGQIAKLCNQLIVGGTLNIVAEALLLAQAATLILPQCARRFAAGSLKAAFWRCTASACSTVTSCPAGRSKASSRIYATCWWRRPTRASCCR